MYIVKIKFTNNKKIYKFKCSDLYRIGESIFINIDKNTTLEISWSKVDYYLKQYIEVDYE